MAQIDVLPAALAAAARAVREAAPDAHVAGADLGDSALTSALVDYLDRQSCAQLLADLEDAAQALVDSAQAYADVEALLLPRVLR
ncbi:MAG: hypothetical protein JWM62_2939 [Frankiales bacterium]|nr:hypothetical protein [Frankiales bacterium]